MGFRVWVWVLFLLSGVRASSYKKCSSIRSNAIRCYGDDLGSVPTNIPQSVESLSIKDDDFTGSFEFPIMQRLKKLTLINVKIGSIPARAFKNLRALEFLLIHYQGESGNVAIEETSFRSMFNLRQIRLINMGLVDLPDYMFSDSSNLNKIYITNQAITTINVDTFQPLARVHQLNLMHNEISHIADGALQCLDRSYRDPRLYLSRNMMTSIPSDITEDTNIKMYIHDNPLICDCNLAIPLNFADRRAACANPNHLRGTALVKLLQDDISYCTPQTGCIGPVIRNGYPDHNNEYPNPPRLEVGEVLRIQCHPGFILNVHPYDVICQADGTFGDAVIPECEEEHNEPEYLEDGTVRVTSSEWSQYPNPVTINCPPKTLLKSCRCLEASCHGVVMKDMDCKIYGTQSNPTKGQITCINEDDVMDRYTDDRTKNYKHVAECKSNFQLTSCSNYIPMMSHVLNHGQLTPMNGRCNVDCGNFECDMGIRCIRMREKAPCDPFSINMGTVTMDGEELTARTSFREGDTVTITCHDGYELLSDGVERNIVECVAGDRYIPEFLPDCFPIQVEITCTLEVIDHVIASPAWSVSEGESIDLRCDSGYSGEPYRFECGVHDTSFQPPIQCREEIIECFVKPVDYMEVYQDGELLDRFTISSGEQVTAQCTNNDDEPVTLTCLASGVLYPTMPSCVSDEEQPEDEDRCKVPRLINGYAVDFSPGDEISRGTNVTFECNRGYKIEEAQYQHLTCISRQYYSPNRLPKCKKYYPKCVVPVLDSGYYKNSRPGAQILEGATLIPVCYTNYKLEGPEKLVCRDDETFGGEVNSCIKEQFNCEIPEITHGYLAIDNETFTPNSEYRMICNAGYWTGHNSYTHITCINGPDYYDPAEIPECQIPYYGCLKVAFPLMKPLTESPRMGARVEVECVEGYTLIGSNTLTCGQKFSYGAQLPRCQLNNMCETPVIENGRVDADTTHVKEGVTISVWCDDGYGIYGDEMMVCEAGEWSGIITPECRPLDDIDGECEFPVIDNGYFLTQSYISAGSTLVLQCDFGYRPASDTTKVMCISGTQFEPATLPKCEALTVTNCPIPNIPNGRVLPEGRISIGQTVEVVCDGEATLHRSWVRDDQVIDEPPHITCGIDGHFTTQLPSCLTNTRKCDPPSIENSGISPTQAINHGHAFLINCLNGFELEDGQTVITLVCNDGSLSPSQAECRPKPPPCEKPHIENGQMVTQTEFLDDGIDQSDTIPFNGKMVIICNNILDGKYQTKCMGNNTWEPPITPCESFCEMPKIEHGSISPSTELVPVWTTLTVNCDKDYHTSSRTFECQKPENSPAKYNIPIPTCVRMTYSCGIPNIANANYNGPRPLYTDERFTIECHDGFELVGKTGTLICYKDRQYSDDLPYCRLTDGESSSCKTPVIQNAIIGGSNLTGHYIRVICEEGYSIEGSSKLRCLNTGRFDAQFPQCIKKPPTSDLMCGQRYLEERTDPVDPQYVEDNVYIGVGSGHQRIHGGQEAQPGEYPWNVRITIKDARFCGGSIIGREWVLTAGHCILTNTFTYCDNRNGDKTCSILDTRSILRIEAGIHNRKDKTNVQSRTATELILHPYFVRELNFIDYDLALIRVNKPFIFNKVVNSVCLPVEGVTNIINNDQLHVTGWGKTETQQETDALQKIVVPFVKRERCNSNESYDGVITETMFCAGYQSGKIDACQGDSGGPLVYMGSNGTFVLGGIVSWGKKCALENFYGVYTNVNYFYNWIMDIMNET